MFDQFSVSVEEVMGLRTEVMQLMGITNPFTARKYDGAFKTATEYMEWLYGPAYDGLKTKCKVALVAEATTLFFTLDNRKAQEVLWGKFGVALGALADSAEKWVIANPSRLS